MGIGRGIGAANTCVLEDEHQRHVFITQAVIVFTQVFLPLAVVSFSWALSQRSVF